MSHTPVTTSTRVVTNRSMQTLYADFYAKVVTLTDPEGPIDALVPWETAATFVQAVEFMTGEQPTCTYHRPGLGHIVHPGRRTVLASLKEES